MSALYLETQSKIKQGYLTIFYSGFEMSFAPSASRCWGAKHVSNQDCCHYVEKGVGILLYPAATTAVRVLLSFHTCTIVFLSSLLPKWSNTSTH